MAIQKKTEKKAETVNTVITQKRLLSVALAAIFLFSVVGIRLGYVTLISGSSLQAKALSQWTRALPMYAQRGTITDTNGNTLAVSYTTYDVYVRAKEIDNPEIVTATLVSILGVAYDSTLIKAKNRGISESKVKSQILEEVAVKIINANMKGVFLSENTKRYYPYGDLLTQVLGLTTIDNIGQAGIEAYYQELLAGIDGKQLTETDLQGKEIDNSLTWYLPSIKGMDLELTIDAGIQIAAEKALDILMAEQKPKSATAIVMNPKNGEILAMSSKPSFDLNNPPRDNVSYLLNSVRNQSIVDVYEPGSTFKILTMAGAIENKVASLTDNFYDPGYRIVDGDKIKCWKLTGHGAQSLTDGLCNSCNSVFVDLALRLGTNRLYSFLKSLGIGNLTGVDFLGEGGGILMKESAVKNVDLARIGFGQTIAVTPIQLITAVSAVVNGGTLPKPHFVKQTTDAFGTTRNYDPNTKQRVLSKSTSDALNMMLEETVSKNVGKLTFIPGYQIGGKTGTSQKYENGRIVPKYVSSFIGTYPASNPDYIILIIADEPTSGAFFGSVVATPYAKMIFSEIFRLNNIKPINEEADLKKVEKNITVPYLIGKSLSEAAGILASLKLIYEIDGEGGIVKNQLIPAGTQVFEYQTVILQT